MSAPLSPSAAELGSFVNEIGKQDPNLTLLIQSYIHSVSSEYRLKHSSEKTDSWQGWTEGHTDSSTVLTLVFESYDRDYGVVPSNFIKKYIVFELSEIFFDGGGVGDERGSPRTETSLTCTVENTEREEHKQNWFSLVDGDNEDALPPVTLAFPHYVRSQLLGAEAGTEINFCDSVSVFVGSDKGEYYCPNMYTIIEYGIEGFVQRIDSDADNYEEDDALYGDLYLCCFSM
jgi:hypothetical protein